MRRSFERLFLLVAAVLPLAVPLSVSADTMSVSQVITITATVPPMRSIIVNDAGQMTMIYSNTDQDVTPKVYKNSTSSGMQLALTPQLSGQYKKVMAGVKNPVGVAIPVTTISDNSGSGILQTLTKSMSTVINQAFLYK